MPPNRLTVFAHSLTHSIALAVILAVTACLQQARQPSFLAPAIAVWLSRCVPADRQKSSRQGKSHWGLATDATWDRSGHIAVHLEIGYAIRAFLFPVRLSSTTAQNLDFIPANW